MIRATLLLSALVLGGCGSLDVSLPGTVRSTVVEARGSSPDRPLCLAFDRLGNLTLNGQVLELPSAREHQRFGVGVVDGGALPPVWRPPHAPAGGVLVAWLDKASPLAVAGLRPFDRVRALNGEPVRGVDDLVARLEVAPGTTVALEVAGPGGGRPVTAEAAEAVDDVQTIGVPLLFDRHKSQVGHAFGFGPLDGVFHYRALTDHTYTDDASAGCSAYVERLEWGALFGLLRYESREDPLTGEGGSRLRVLGLPLWDDLEG